MATRMLERPRDERRCHAQHDRASIQVSGLSLLALAVLAFHPAHAQQDFYKGKTVRLIVGQAAGGGYDTYGRLLAPFLTQFLPGQPAVTVQNMPGAGSILMANYLYSAGAARRHRHRARRRQHRAPRRCSAPPAPASTRAGSAGSAA